jgi:serine/threonine protein kinase/Tol biopolymer transport system component
MNPSAWKRAKSLLADAADLPAADRDRFVAEHCPDPELRREVLELLASPAPLSGIVSASALESGARLGPYVIERLLGSGGMGEVYQARDTTLNRSVAIKVLPPPFVGDAERLARLRREAQLLAALNHPNIAQIHGFEESTGVAALVMELVDGPTLGDRIAAGAIPLADALTIAKQIANALEAAHEHGIVHRDLKPANIKIRDDGTVKVLDFGLAKALDLTPQSSAAAFSSLTSPVGATQPGFILGTAAYMAPEQARGKPVDKRADIWSFGCVLYEMITGTRAFEGDEMTDTLALVLTKEPDWTGLPPNTPAPIRMVLRRCLEKDRSRRLADVADARLDIEEALSPSIAPSAVIAPDRHRRAARPGHVVPWVIAAALGAVLALVLVFGSPWQKIPVSTPLRVSVDPGGGEAIVTTNLRSSIALSPDGAQLAFVAHRPAETTRRLYVRRLDQLQAALLAETDDADGPSFSPDGQWLVFFAHGKLKKIAVTGGTAVTLCDAPNGRGATWGDDGTIVFSPDTQAGLARVSSSGGTPETFTTRDKGELTERWPQILPGGKAVLFTSLSPSGADFDFDKANIVVESLSTGVRKVVQHGGYSGRYLPSGHLVYLHNGTLFAAAFDPARLEMTSPPMATLESVVTNTTAGSGMFAISNSGVAVFMSNGSAGSHDSTIEWMDRSGKSSSLRSVPANWGNLSFSPDGRRLAFDVFDGKQWDIWVDDWARDASARLTSSPTHSMNPVWTPDGRRIAFASLRGEKTPLANRNLYWQRADGTGDVQRLTNSPNEQRPGSWHPSGKFLAFDEQTPSNVKLMLLQIDGDEESGWKPAEPTVLLTGSFDQRAPRFSPEGRWLAYDSNQSGQFEVYVRPFPGPGTQLQISTGGAVFPTWSRARHELLYSTFDRRVMVATYSVEGDSFHAEQPRPWPEGRYMARGSGLPRWEFDLHPDGNRLALATRREPQPAAQQNRLVLILNFFDELRRIAPRTK